MKVEGVSNLEFADTSLLWRGQPLRYRDVKSVTWSATVTQNSINGIPTGKSYSAGLALQMMSGERIAIYGDPGVLGGLGKKGFEGLAQVAEVISALTFAYRVSRIENQLRDRRFFQYGDFQFHDSGDLFHKGVVKCSLVSPKTKWLLNNVFELTIIPERADRSILGLFKDNSIKFNLYTDRDCFLYLLHGVYGISFRGEKLRNKRYPARETFYETVLRFGALLASADGNAEARELLRLKDFFGLSSQQFPEAAEIYNSQLQAPLSTQEIFSSFGDCFADAQELKETFLFGMAEVAMSDGEAHPREVALLWEAIRLLSIDQSIGARILESAGITSNFEQEGRAPGYRSPSTRAQCCAVLGVGVDASDDEIRRAFRELVRRYHPDVLRSQNLPEEELERLGLMMRRINDAYSWLKESF